MDIIRNLKPLKHTGNETREELLIILNKWVTWYQNTLAKIEADYKDDVAGYKHRDAIRQKEVNQEREARSHDGFSCKCHSYCTTIGVLHDSLVAEEAWGHKVRCFVNRWEEDDND